LNNKRQADGAERRKLKRATLHLNGIEQRYF